MAPRIQTKCSNVPSPAKVSRLPHTTAATTALEAITAARSGRPCPSSREATLPEPMPMVKPTA